MIPPPLLSLFPSRSQLLLSQRCHHHHFRLRHSHCHRRHRRGDGLPFSALRAILSPLGIARFKITSGLTFWSRSSGTRHLTARFRTVSTVPYRISPCQSQVPVDPPSFVTIISFVCPACSYPKVLARSISVNPLPSLLVDLVCIAGPDLGTRWALFPSPSITTIATQTFRFSKGLIPYINDSYDHGRSALTNGWSVVPLAYWTRWSRRQDEDSSSIYTATNRICVTRHGMSIPAS